MNLPIPKEPPEVITEQVKSVIRKVLSASGAILIYKYGVSPEMVSSTVEMAIGLGAGAVSLAWSTVWGVLNARKLIKE